MLKVLFAIPATLVPAIILSTAAWLRVSTDWTILLSRVGPVTLGDAVDLLFIVTLGAELYKSTRTDNLAALNNVASVIVAFAFTAGVLLIPALWTVCAGKAIVVLLIDAAIAPVMTAGAARRDLQILS
jgi:hypothetical protein